MHRTRKREGVPMSGVIKNLRSGADRAAFEANKLLRVQRIQYEQRVREQQRRQSVAQLGEAVWRLYAQGRIDDPELLGICHQIQTATHELAELEKTLAQVRDEQAPQPRKCLDCGHDLAPGDAFCAFCGARNQTGSPAAVPLHAPAAPATPATAVPAAAAAAATCPRCGRPVRPAARFCGHCGHTRTP